MEDAAVSVVAVGCGSCGGGDLDRAAGASDLAAVMDADTGRGEEVAGLSSGMIDSASGQAASNSASLCAAIVDEYLGEEEVVGKCLQAGCHCHIVPPAGCLA